MLHKQPGEDISLLNPALHEADDNTDLASVEQLWIEQIERQMRLEDSRSTHLVDFVEGPGHVANHQINDLPN